MNNPNPIDSGTRSVSIQARESALANTILQQCPLRPKFGIVLGSGLAGLVERMEVVQSWPFHELPGFANSTATGHPGQFILGRWRDTEIAVLQGRLHLYEGHTWSQVVYPVRVMHALGIEGLVLSNAAGGVNPYYRVGDLMLLREHINLLPSRVGRVAEAHCPSTITANPGQSSRSVYDPTWISHAIRRSRHRAWSLHCGTYAALPGPNYETRAEYRMLRTLGVDAVGMSTVPESLLAAQLGLRVFGISVITNACTPDAISATSGEAVIAAARRVEKRVMEIIDVVLEA